jgi:hypothetical protein
MHHDWRSRPGHRGGIELYRQGPSGLTLSVSQPHDPDGYWRMYWGICPVVRHHLDLGVFGTSLEAVLALDKLAADDMRTALLD